MTRSSALVRSLVAATRTSSSYGALAARVGVAQSHREARWLAEHVIAASSSTTQMTLPNLSSSSSISLSSNGDILQRSLLTHLLQLMESRAAGTPLQYLIGTTSFCGLELKCRAPTLIPRPETEQMCDWLLHVLLRKHAAVKNPALAAGSHWPSKISFQDSFVSLHGSKCNHAAPNVFSSFHPQPVRIVDACSGSGNITLALSAHLPAFVSVIGLEKDARAVELSLENQNDVSCQHPHVLQSTSFVQCDLLSSCSTSLFSDHAVDMIVSNPPYIALSEREHLSVEVRDHEDPAALFAAEEGLIFYRRLLELSSAWLRPLHEQQSKWQNEQSRQLDQRATSSSAAAPSATSSSSRLQDLDLTPSFQWPELLFEIADHHQAKAVQSMCTHHGFAHSQIFLDWFDRPRWIAATRCTLLSCGR